jgi:hypothetical protein
MVTAHGQLVAYKEELGYVTYVFKDLDTEEYVMCTKFPKWNSEPIGIGDCGYIEYKEIIAGKDTWYNGSEQIPYIYEGCQFIKFVPIKNNVVRI